MPLFLGKDGKQRATESCAGIARTVPPLYFGLLDTLPSGADSMTLAQLVAGVTGEHSPTGTEGALGCWYADGRQPISFGNYGVVSPLICTSNNAHQWLNRTSTTKFVGGLFIATVKTGTVGELLWVGYPDIGRFPVYNDRGVEWSNGLVDLKVI